MTENYSFSSCHIKSVGQVENEEANGIRTRRILNSSNKFAAFYAANIELWLHKPLPTVTATVTAKAKAKARTPNLFSDFVSVCFKSCYYFAAAAAAVRAENKLIFKS
ncbi:CLUMA_CG000282, isoform A [Clunio marinus]|uniref:CLUMA_CG000282, isoform A n=1 Tax=Clunio marinus TaxID=568069 RepID=A0A1J1HG52_9DIPT|nr:CLUMA_CG000282, isoform A [Clunio marinus]